MADKDRYEPLFAAVEERRPRRILDIGVWTGEHGASMIRIAQKYGPVEYYGFDLWEHCPEWELPKQPPPIEQVRPVLEATGATIRLFKGNTRETLPAADLPAMDFIFIDGGHSLETIDSDWATCSKLMNYGSVVIFDDYYTERTDAGAKPLVDKLALDPKYRVKICPIYEFPHLKVSMAMLSLQ